MKKIESFIVEENEDTQQQTIDLSIGTNNLFLKTNVDLIFDSNKDKERVLCIGEVQSGKTSNIIECIRRSIELNYDAVIFFAGTNNLLRLQSHQRVEKSNLNEFKIFDPDQKNYIDYYLNNNLKFIINVLKETKTFDNLFTILNNLKLSNRKILLIDDECDYGSVNTGSTSNPKLYHEKIEKIYAMISYGKLLQFTATPFANILNDKNINNDVPRVVVLKKYDDYCGLSFFNSYEKNIYVDLYGDDEFNDVRLINDSTLTYLLTTVNIKFDNQIKNKKTQFLLNIGQETINHENIYKKVLIFLKEFYEGSKYENEISILYLKKYSINFQCIFELGTYIDEIKKIIKNIFDNESVYILNSKEHELKEKFLKQNDLYQIVVGGTMLSRGLTFENLITELMMNHPSNKISLDVLLQRCRWFGNRKEKVKYFNIFLSRKLMKALEIAERKYLNLLKPGEHNFFELKNKLKISDKECEVLYGVKGTSYGKSK